MKIQTRVISQALIVLVLFLILAFGGTVLAATQVQQSQFVAPILVANTSFLNVRSGPGIQYSVRMTVVGGTELPVLGVARDRVWYQVSSIIGVGWVNVEYTVPRGDFTRVPFVEAPSIRPGGVVVQTDVAQLGQGGGGQVPFAVQVVPAPLVQVTSTGLPERLWGASFVDGGGDVRSGPSDQSANLRLMFEDLSQIYPLTGAASGDGRQWLQILIPDLGNGWVEAHHLKLRPLACAGESVVLVVGPTALQGGPDGTQLGPIPPTVSAGTEAFVLDVREGLVKIQVIEGAIGWIPLSVTLGRTGEDIVQHCPSGFSGAPSVGTTMITTTTTGGITTTSSLPTSFASSATPRVVVNTGNLNIRTGPSASYTILTTVSGGTELPVIGRAPDGVWYLIQGPFGQGWLNNEFVVFRGSLQFVPIIREVTGVLATPSAVIAGRVTLLAAPNNAGLGIIGELMGPVEVPVVARTADFSWVQVSTSVGFGWVPVTSVTLKGDTGLIPVVS